jgi:hypothetical protein
MALDDAIGNSQSKTRALAYFLSRKEGIEQFIKMFGRYAAPCIPDRNLYTLRIRGVAGNADTGSYYDSFILLGGVKGIEQQIEQNALYLIGIKGKQREPFV